MDDEDLPEWYRIVRKVLREFECITQDGFDGVGGQAAYAQLRYAAEREMALYHDVEQMSRNAAEHCMEQTGTGLPLLSADTSETDGGYWVCLRCNEMNKVSSAICQDCQSPRPEHYAIWHYSQARS